MKSGQGTAKPPGAARRLIFGGGRYFSASPLPLPAGPAARNPISSSSTSFFCQYTSVPQQRWHGGNRYMGASMGYPRGNLTGHVTTERARGTGRAGVPAPAAAGSILAAPRELAGLRRPCGLACLTKLPFSGNTSNAHLIIFPPHPSRSPVCLPTPPRSSPPRPQRGQNRSLLRASPHVPRPLSSRILSTRE